VNIGSILWPLDKREAVNLYLGFLIKIVEYFGFRFSSDGPDPISISKAYIAGTVSEQDYRECANVWWAYLDGSGAIRNLTDEDALLARIAICLLSVTKEDAEELGEHLSWFFEVLEQVGVDIDKPIDMMVNHFKFTKN